MDNPADVIGMPVASVGGASDPAVVVASASAPEPVAGMPPAPAPPVPVVEAAPVAVAAEPELAPTPTPAPAPVVEAAPTSIASTLATELPNLRRALTMLRSNSAAGQPGTFIYSAIQQIESSVSNLELAADK